MFVKPSCLFLLGCVMYKLSYALDSHPKFCNYHGIRILWEVGLDSSHNWKITNKSKQVDLTI